MNITSPLLKGAGQMALLPGDSVTSLLKVIGDFVSAATLKVRSVVRHTRHRNFKVTAALESKIAGALRFRSSQTRPQRYHANFGIGALLFNDGPDGGLGILMSGLAGAAAALAVAIALTVYFGSGFRSRRDLVKHGIAVVLVCGLVAFVAYDMRHAALAYLGINPEKPAVEFEIRIPQAALSATSDAQIELRTDRNQSLAQLQGADDFGDGRSVLRGTVRLDYRTTDRMVVLNLPGRAQCEFKLRLAADPSRSGQFGPWHLADRVVLPSADEPANRDAHSAFAIRYRVL